MGGVCSPTTCKGPRAMGNQGILALLLTHCGFLQGLTVPSKYRSPEVQTEPSRQLKSGELGAIRRRMTVGKKLAHGCSMPASNVAAAHCSGWDARSNLVWPFLTGPCRLASLSNIMFWIQ